MLGKRLEKLVLLTHGPLVPAGVVDGFYEPSARAMADHDNVVVRLELFTDLGDLFRISYAGHAL